MTDYTKVLEENNDIENNAIENEKFDDYCGEPTKKFVQKMFETIESKYRGFSSDNFAPLIAVGTFYKLFIETIKEEGCKKIKNNNKSSNFCKYFTAKDGRLVNTSTVFDQYIGSNDKVGDLEIELNKERMTLKNDIASAITAYDELDCAYKKLGQSDKEIFLQIDMLELKESHDLLKPLCQKIEDLKTERSNKNIIRETQARINYIDDLAFFVPEKMQKYRDKINKIMFAHDELKKRKKQIQDKEEKIKPNVEELREKIMFDSNISKKNMINTQANEKVFKITICDNGQKIVQTVEDFCREKTATVLLTDIVRLLQDARGKSFFNVLQEKGIISSDCERVLVIDSGHEIRVDNLVGCVFTNVYFTLNSRKKLDFVKSNN